MNTQQLIDALASDVPAVRRRALGWRLGLGMAAGGIVTAGFVGGWLGFRPDLWLAMQGWEFWMKWIYTGSLGCFAAAATLRLARPDCGSMRWLWASLLPVIGLAAIGMAEMAHTPVSQWLAMWLGESWKVCSRNVFLLAMPIFAGLLWSFRKLAPTRLRAAGAAAGLCAGAWAATLYCLHCPEVSAIFVLTWYSLGIVLTAALGALLGPKLLRW